MSANSLRKVLYTAEAHVTGYISCVGPTSETTR